MTTDRFDYAVDNATHEVFAAFEAHGFKLFENLRDPSEAMVEVNDALTTIMSRLTAAAGYEGED